MRSRLTPAPAAGLLVVLTAILAALAVAALPLSGPALATVAVLAVTTLLFVHGVRRDLRHQDG